MPRLLTDPSGPGSIPDIEEYIRTVLEQRIIVNDDTSAERLARAIRMSVLHRLGYVDATDSAGVSDA